MNRFINRLKLVFLALFAVGCVGVWTYQLMWARPQAICEGQHGWWDWRTRICGHPIPLWMLTHRKDGHVGVEKLAPGQKAPVGATPDVDAAPAAPAAEPKAPAKP